MSRNKLSNLLLLVALLAAMMSTSSGFAAEPFAHDDFDVVYTDTATVHYLVNGTCLPGQPCPGFGENCNSPSKMTTRACNVSVHRFCSAQGHESGFGVENDVNPTDIDIICLTPKAASIVEGVTLADLQAKLGTCTSLQPSKACSVAIDRYCRQQTPSPRVWHTGFGPLEGTTTQTSIACIRSDIVPFFAGPPSNVEQQQAGCSFASATISTECRQAMDHFCETEGADLGKDLRGGFGITDYSPTGMSVPCVEKRWPWTSNLPAMPESPALPIDIIGQKIDVASGTYFNHLEHSALSASRSQSFDGRLSIKPIVVDDVGAVTELNFRLQTPEIFTKPLSQAQDPNRDRSYETARFNNNFYGIKIPAGLFHSSTGGYLKAGSAICDPHQGSTPIINHLNRQQNVPERQSNPFVCDSNGNVPPPGVTSGFKHDCYDVSVITVYDEAPHPQNDLDEPDQLWEARVRIVVENPKGSDENLLDLQSVHPSPTRAKVIAVSLLNDGLPNPRSVNPMINAARISNILEPNITGDGRLLVIQGDGKLRYSVMPESADACDVTQWDTFRPIAEMHSDPAMSEYGIAKYPMRDHEGNVVTKEITGAYPWVDRDGDNMMFMLGAATLYYMDGSVAKEKFEVLAHPIEGTASMIPCQPGFRCDTGFVPLHPANYDEVMRAVDRLPREGLTFVGLWSQGKMFSPDNRNNAVDFGVKGGLHSHRIIRLYSDQPAGNEVGPSIRTDINSAQNQFFYHPNLLPDTPREVVWTVSTQDQTDEVAFDDVLDPRALIISSMNVSIKPSPTEKGRFQDGFFYDQNDDYRGEGFQRPAHIANAATSVSDEVVAQALAESGVDLSANVQWNTPAFGYLLGGARAEPIAAGGFKGKGLWLDGLDDRLEYLVPPPPSTRVTDMQNSPWFYSISIDPRDLSRQRRLLRLPDDNWLDVVDSQTLRLGRYGYFDVAIPAALELKPGVWSTVSVVSEPASGGGSNISVYLDGYLLKTQYVIQNFYRMTSGRVTVGDTNHNGFRGWVDDFKIIARKPNPEVICNHARGTLVGVQLNSESTDPNEVKAMLYPTESHDAISNLPFFDQDFPGYACERPIANPTSALDLYSYEHYTCLGQTRRTTVAECVRDGLLFPEGPLFVDKPRPDVLLNPENTFCTSCHIDSNPSQTMRTNALIENPSILMPDDPRRQPMQHPPSIFGNILEYLFGDAPTSKIQAPVEGEPLDPYTGTCKDDPTKCDTP